MEEVGPARTQQVLQVIKACLVGYSNLNRSQKPKQQAETAMSVVGITLGVCL